MESGPLPNQESVNKNYAEEIVAALNAQGKAYEQDDVLVQGLNDDLVKAIEEERKIGFKDTKAEQAFVTDYIRNRINN